MADETTPEPVEAAVEETAAPAPAPPTPTAPALKTETSPAAKARADRKVREGIVYSTSMDKTVVVKVVERVRHPRYAKTLQRTTKLYAHDATNDCRAGDRVRLTETRPLSKLKRWRVVEVLERAK